MNDLNWKYGNFSMMDVELEAYNTLYVDKASIDNDGLILWHKDRAIGFISLISLFKIGRLLNKVYISRTGLLLTNTSFYMDALMSLEEFVVSEGIVIISQVDYIYKKLNHASRVSSFLGNKQTIINIIDDDVEPWLLQIKKKHRYYVRKAIKSDNKRFEVKTIDSIAPSFHGQLYDIYAENMSNKGVNLLFSTKDEFLNFINRNLKSIIVTIGFKGDEISYFNVVHTNKEVANYIMAVTTKLGMSSYASYLGVYKLYDYLYSHNFKILNFGGVDPVNNHGVYLFKRGFSGELFESPSYMIIGVGLIAWVAKRTLQLRMLVTR
jgi:hypothetical protein